MFVHVFVRLSALPLTFSNMYRLCQWLVIYNNKRQLTIEIGFLHSESQPIMSFLSKVQSQSLVIFKFVFTRCY